MFKKSSKYIWFQVIGWSTYIGISLFFGFTFGKSEKEYFISLILTCVLGVVITHIMRKHIHAWRVLEKSLIKQIVLLFILTLIYSVVLGGVSEYMDYLMGYNPATRQKFTQAERVFLSSFNAMWLILIWNMIYYIYHYVERNRHQQMEAYRLETTVKELELKTIKAHINPHFIFNSLNSIRALVDENPARARKAITELSNILRSSMQAEKMETVPLKQELDIVSDYLALEQMRFEERLKIEMNINEDTLNQPIPPMMLQTLVENAIKHGISKQINGGLIRITSNFTDRKHELIVQNSGKLNGSIMKDDGFGVKSTRDRLNLLYQGKAHFQIYDIEGGMVECKIQMPMVEFL